MVRVHRRPTPRPRRSPRSGGDGPTGDAIKEFSIRFSPLRRGWSQQISLFRTHISVLPAQAGMVRATPTPPQLHRRSPRSGGDGPVRLVTELISIEFSPLRRGWSDPRSPANAYAPVLPAQAGMVLLHGQAGILRPLFSPLRRGWSPPPQCVATHHPVLPAQAGMVPFDAKPRSISRCSPRSGGDGPVLRDPLDEGFKFSPLRRGWSRCIRVTTRGPRVLPAQAGMVPSLQQHVPASYGSPRSGGDGPVASENPLYKG